MKWGSEEREPPDQLKTYPPCEISPIAAASILTLGVSEVKSKMSESLDSIIACVNSENRCLKRGSSVSLMSEEYSGLALGYFGLSAVLSAVYFPAMGFYLELVKLSEK